MFSKNADSTSKKRDLISRNNKYINEVKDFNQEGSYLQPLTSIGHYINSKKRTSKSTSQRMPWSKISGFFRTNRGLPSKEVRICHNMTWHSLISRISYSKPWNCNLLYFQLLCWFWFSNMSCLTKSRKNVFEPEGSWTNKNRSPVFLSHLNVTLMGWTTHQLKTTGCRWKKNGHMRAAALSIVFWGKQKLSYGILEGHLFWQTYILDISPCCLCRQKLRQDLASPVDSCGPTVSTGLFWALPRGCKNSYWAIGWKPCIAMSFIKPGPKQWMGRLYIQSFQRTEANPKH